MTSRLTRLATYVIIMNATLRPRLEGDSEALVHGSGFILSCFKTGESCSEIGHFPLFQYLIALVARQLLPLSDVLPVLAYVSGAAVAILVGIAVDRFQRYTPEYSSIMALILLASPLAFYSASTFGEGLAAFLILGFVTAFVNEQTWLAFVMCFLAGITKEIAPAFLIALACAVIAGDVWRCDWKRLYPVGAAAVMAFVANGAFNVLRFGTWWNATLMDPLFQVPTLTQHASQFAGLLFSPSGGVLFFIPLLLPLFVAVGAQLVWRRSSWRYMQSFIILSGSFVGLLIGFSRWFTPFGWFGWGPRFLVPWFPSLAFLLIWLYFAEVRAALDWLVAKLWRFSLFAGAVVLLTIPQLASVYEASTVQVWFTPGVDCPTRAVIQENAPYYYECLNRATWHPTRLTLVEVVQGAWVEHPWVTILLTLLHIGLWASLWAQLKRK